ncbi:hypothetical protein BH24DEI1_BH24DEI1_00920 [soil metagenome]|jgi:hypothetical protein|nr:hypothetical protein [Deinococcota bacterium]
MAKSKTYTPHAVNAYGTDLGIVYYGELGLPDGLAEKYLKEKTEILVQVLDKTVRAQVTEKLAELDAQGARLVRFEGCEGFWSEESLGSS